MWIKVAWGSLILGALLLVYLIYTSGRLEVGSVMLLGLLAVGWLYTRSDTHSVAPYRYLLPGLATFALFVVFPIVYTVSISFTHYGSAHLLSYERLWDQYFSQQVFDVSPDVFQYEIFQTDSGYELLLTEETRPRERYLYSDFDPAQQTERVGTLIPIAEVDPSLTTQVPIRQIIQWKPALVTLQLELPDGQRLQRTGLRHFKPRELRYERQADQSLLDRKTGDRLTPDFQRGYYVDQDQQRVGPGFVTSAGFSHYLRIVQDPAISGPFFRVFLWTLVFAGGSVGCSLGVGFGLAVILNWESLAGRQLYRSLFILPYAIPAFISILIFRGLFNPRFGEINTWLQGLVGIQPDWFSDPWLAKVMVLLVNTWLSYPYMMILILGLLQAIPASLYEAAAIDGAGPLDHFFRITVPLTLPPLKPILISSFAFSFNNFVLIFLLTGGGPNMLDTSTPVGETDILVSYTYRLAFGQAEADYGFAAAIATLIFGLVALLALLQLRLSAPDLTE